jgi:hypothetical protein
MLRRFHRWPDLVIIIVLALLPGLYFWRLLAPNPVDRLSIRPGDFTEQYFPLRAYTAREWVNGRVPLWNPALFGGQPALADIQSGALYPPHVLQALVLGWAGLGFPLEAQNWQMIAHFSWAAVGAYFLGRHLARYWRGSNADPAPGRAGPASGVLAILEPEPSEIVDRQVRQVGVIVSISFTYGGYLTGFPVQQLTILAVSAWLPWLIWLLSITLDRVVEAEPRWRATLAAAGWTGLVFGLSILAGHPQTTLYVFYISLAYTGFRAMLVWRRTTGGRGLGRAAAVAGHWLLAIILGLALAAAQVLPTVEFIRHSLRADLDYEAVARGLPLNELTAIVYPGFFGGSPQYVGIVTLVLVGVALAIGWPRRETWFWGGLGLAGLGLGLGGHTFLYPLFYLLAPGFDAVRQQERAFLIYSLAASILAGQGALALARPIPTPLRTGWRRFQHGLGRAALVALALTGPYIYGSTVSRIRGDEVNLMFGVLRHHVFGLMILAGTLALMALRPKRRFWRRWGLLLVAGWSAFNLFSINWRFNLERPPAGGAFTPDAMVQFLKAETARQAEPLRVASNGLLPGGHNAASVYGLLDVTGNTPLQLASGASLAAQTPSWRYWQLMSIHYVVDARLFDDPGLQRIMEADQLQVYAVTDPFPFARLVYDVMNVPDPVLAQEMLTSDAMDLVRQAVLSGSWGSGWSPTPSRDPAGTVSIDEYEPTGVRLIVDVPADALLVLSQIYYPGWQATVDGHRVDLLAVNLVFQGVPLRAGSHTIQISYKPASFRWGAILSGLGVILTGALIGAGRYRRR